MKTIKQEQNLLKQIKDLKHQLKVDETSRLGMSNLNRRLSIKSNEDTRKVQDLREYINKLEIEVQFLKNIINSLIKK